MCTATTTKNKAKFHFHQRSLIQTQTDLKNTLTQTFQIYKNKNKNHGNQHYAPKKRYPKIKPQLKQSHFKPTRRASKTSYFLQKSTKIKPEDCVP
jgi:hypothetical protein